LLLSFITPVTLLWNVPPQYGVIPTFVSPAAI